MVVKVQYDSKEVKKTKTKKHTQQQHTFKFQIQTKRLYGKVKKGIRLISQLSTSDFAEPNKTAQSSPSQS